MKWIDKCLSSLRNSIVPTIPVVIDNCSSDGTVSHIKANYPEAVLMPQDRNLGFGQANNAGMRYALKKNADFVFLLNQDAYVAPDCLSHILNSYKDDEDCLLSPVHLNGDGTRLDLGFKRNAIIESACEIIDDSITGNTRNDRYQVSFVNAACWFLPVRTIKRIGGFNPIFFHYGEDMNYTHRLTFHNIPIYIVRDARVRHDRSFVGNIKVFKKGEVKRELLIEACNVNHSLLSRLKRYYRICLNHKSHPLECLQSMLWLIGYVKTASSRAGDRKTGPQWL